ncbi:hypothetical protein FDP41_006576 [Naegleria fowleri]|uniref:Uncharacterized protein n=1 Tax=Naegleria fowleri TaxID=5763 RepID=A0A6A5BKF8_NAEFO|nr:uncharacterized protein FDP41_006576 [Naegleria fowleri]KAF0974544.1 hypothetical protein FDP41_006576 [Naegleria fowleri]CAG4708214.1 unnamed protein product [Naegleria fowleri]
MDQNIGKKEEFSGNKDILGGEKNLSQQQGGLSSNLNKGSEFMSVGGEKRDQDLNLNKDISSSSKSTDVPIQRTSNV